MRGLLFVLAFGLAPEAHALSQKMSGFYAELGAGTGAGGTPFRFGVGWQGSAGWWRGSYDDVYSLGRYVSVGLTLRQDYTVNGLRTAPLLEVRRGMDLLVAGLHGHLGVGPLIDASGVGVGARAGIGAKLRRHAFWGVTLRLEGGVDYVDGRIGGQFGALVGGAFSRPFRELNLRH